ncbi:MAG: putative glycosyl transferase family 1 protein [Neobacillus sp.]|jgi:glycosyltransferase involved in cell wall biosynthesis|nr:putative glycosyl transferase family 1 protein [Neobacillus sp.]
MKILYVTTVGMTMRFFEPLIRKLLNSDNAVDIACNEAISKIPDCYRQWGCDCFPISWERSPFSSGNLNAIKQIRNIVNDGHYDIVHCHTPIAAACTRIACRQARKNGLKVIYTAHGFHFYKGAPLKNWLIYYSVEMLCSRWTDVLITINREDYELAKKKMYAKRTYYVPGVGIDVGKFANTIVDRDKKRAEIGIPSDAVVLISVGELSKRKNHEVILRAISGIKNKNIFYCVVGRGSLYRHLINLSVKLGISDNIRFLGFRSDINELLKTSNIFCLPSLQEGLPVALMEAMASGLPCIVSKIRGNVDLVDKNGAVLFDPYNVDDCREVIQNLLNLDREKFGQYNTERIKKFENSAIIEQMIKIYQTL